MNIEEIRANKPDGATHYHETKYGAIYLKRDKSFIFFKKWVSYNDSLRIWTDCHIHRLLEIKPL